MIVFIIIKHGYVVFTVYLRNYICVETITPSLDYVNKVSYAYRIQEEDITPLFIIISCRYFSQSTAKLQHFAIYVNRLAKNKFGSVLYILL